LEGGDRRVSARGRRIVRGLILAGGHGTRLRPLTFTGNKHMIPIANQPILFYGLRHLAEAGIREVGVVLGPIQEGIQEAIGDGSSFGLRVQYIHQGDPKGLAHAVLCARPFLGDESFVMYLGDNLLQQGVRPFVDLYERERPDAVIGATPVPEPRHYGVVELDGERIVSIEEKPPHPKSDLALIGVYLFTPSIHPIIEALRPSARGELEITEAIWQLHRAGRRVLVQRVQGWWKDTGLPGDLLEANERVLASLPPEAFRRDGRVASGARVIGSVGIGPESLLEDGCEVTGPVVLGRGVRVGRGSRIGPSTAIGDRAQILGASVQHSILLEGARVEGPVTIRDSIVGRNVSILAPPGRDREVSVIVGDAAQLRV
jgi:glucose-1-phosphate thymidylyltransferase